MNEIPGARTLCEICKQAYYSKDRQCKCTAANTHHRQQENPIIAAAITRLNKASEIASRRQNPSEQTTSTLTESSGLRSKKNTNSITTSKPSSPPHSESSKIPKAYVVSPVGSISRLIVSSQPKLTSDDSSANRGPMQEESSDVFHQRSSSIPLEEKSTGFLHHDTESEILHSTLLKRWVSVWFWKLYSGW